MSEASFDDVERLFFRTPDGGKFTAIPIPGSEMPFAVVHYENYEDDDANHEVYPWAEVEVNPEAREGRFVIRTYEKITEEIKDHPKTTATFVAGAVFTGVATIIALRRRNK